MTAANELASCTSITYATVQDMALAIDASVPFIIAASCAGSLGALFLYDLIQWAVAELRPRPSVAE